MLILLIGGAGSGKSRLAARLADEAGAPVVFVATGEARDDEMSERIRRHRDDRPAGWVTVEEPVELRSALAAVPESSTAIVDCLTLWVSNLMERGRSDEDVESLARGASAEASARAALTIVVTNEVGAGIVPANPMARRYRDVLGRVNALWAEAADDVSLVVAGRVLRLAPADELAGRIRRE
jgi:adenosylcobinamide kinase / adenosylcobinamide-phosphate guanylyltransferase